MGGAAEQALLLVGNEVVEDLLELRGIAVGIERQARKGHQRLTEEAGIKPGESCRDLLAVVVVADEGVGAADELLAALKRWEDAKLAGTIPPDPTKQVYARPQLTKNTHETIMYILLF